jgi:hypothetical protein
MNLLTNSTMNWKSADKDLPKHKQEVLTSIEGIYAVAIFDYYEKGFKIKESGKFYWTKDGDIIYWCEIL